MKHPNPNFDALAFLETSVISTCDRDIVELNRHVLEHEQFRAWPGSHDKHHAHEGGLVLHTAEVMLTVRDAVKNSANVGEKPLDVSVLVTATLWHDFGKIWDYERNPDYAAGLEDEKDTPSHMRRPFRTTKHRDKIRHVARSYSEFMYWASLNDWRMGLDRTQWIEDVGHCILAHHGRKDWGSPIEPQTPEAWALHLADMVSVRVFDRAQRT
jgi:3'-5' exoribonuclease